MFNLVLLDSNSEVTSKLVIFFSFINAKALEAGDFLNINKGFEFNLIGKNKTAAEAKKAGDEAYKQEQADRKKISRQDHYQYGEGRRSKLKQVAKKGGHLAPCGSFEAEISKRKNPP